MQATFMYIDLDKAEIILEKLKCMSSQPEWLLGIIISVRVTLTVSDYYRLSSRIICSLSNDKTIKNSDGLYTGKKSQKINRSKTAAGILSSKHMKLRKLEKARKSCKLIQKTASPHLRSLISNTNLTYLGKSYPSSSLNFPDILNSTC